MEYTRLSLSEVGSELEALARETEATFGALDARQLNWRPDANRWSVAQCFAHVVAANDMMLRKAEEAQTASAPRSVWQCLPLLPGLFGRLLVQSQAPTATRKYVAPSTARPSSSDIDPAVIARFVAQQRDDAMRVRRLDDETARRTIMTSPFVKIITYSVLDGWRLIAAHGRRHFQQAKRVLESPGFPR